MNWVKYKGVVQEGRILNPSTKKQENCKFSPTPKDTNKNLSHPWIAANPKHKKEKKDAQIQSISK